MTKKLCAAFAAVMTIATVLFLSSCGSDGMENVSERRSSYLYASDAQFSVTAVSGVREQPYAADGRAQALKPYTLVTVVPAKFDVDAEYSFKASTPKGEYGGALVVHPFAASFSAEFDAETTDKIVVTVTGGGVTQEYELKSLVPENAIGYERAIDAADSALKAPRGAHEIRVRLIKNPIGGDGLCWHVAYYYKNGTECGALIDCVSAKTLAKKM